MNEVPNRAHDPKRKFAPDAETSMHEIQMKQGDGDWSTAYSYQGQGLQAIRHYKGINVGNGYSKRFIVDGKTINTTHS